MSEMVDSQQEKLGTDMIVKIAAENTRSPYPFKKVFMLFVAELGMTPTEYHHFYDWVQDTASKMRLVFGNLGDPRLDDDFCTIGLSDAMSHGTEQSLEVCFAGITTAVDWRHVQNPEWSGLVVNALAYAIKHHGYNQNK